MLNIVKNNTKNVINKVNDYQFVFDIPQIQEKVEKNIKNNEKPDILLDFVLPQLLTTEEIYFIFFFFFFMYLFFSLQNKLYKKMKTNREYLIKIHLVLISSEIQLSLTLV